MINTVRQLMHNIRLFCGSQCSAASSWRQARTKIFRTTDEADTAHVVSPVFRPVLSKGAIKAKIVWHLSMLL